MVAKPKAPKLKPKKTGSIPLAKAPKQPPIPPSLDEKPILYAKSGGPPADWRNLRIVNLATGKEIRDVHEADAFNGWVKVAVRDEADPSRFKSQGGSILMRRLDVRIRIERRP